MRREIRLREAFDAREFARAFGTFRELYKVAPERATCAPDVFARCCVLFATASATHRHSTQLRFEGVPLGAAILAPGTLAMEGEVDETEMGDW